MTSGSAVTPPVLRWRIAGMVIRRSGDGVGCARLVAVSSWKVVDMTSSLAQRARLGKGGH
jgi:hypothetical protein